MPITFLLHGVPDSPAMWQPLLTALGPDIGPVETPALPGFSTPIPPGFACTKDAYVDWFIAKLETACVKHGQSHIVGHDWGALIVVRAASLRPDLVATWTAANALPHPDYQWHTMARRWQTPLLGELTMAMIGPKAMQRALIAQGLPAPLAKEEATHWNADMKRAVLALYRSARTAGRDWYSALANLPKQGLIFWGEDDPYLPLWVAEAVAKDTGTPLLRQSQTGHWSVVERSIELAAALRPLWGLAPSGA